MIPESGRVLRSLALDVELLEDGAYLVTGGAEPHAVRCTDSGWSCDCMDARFHEGWCKHQWAVDWFRQLDGRARHALREAVGALP